MNIGLFGGSFDPIHDAHRSMVEAAWRGGRLDRLIVMPVGVPPHKSRRLSLAPYRYEMCELALSDLPFVELSSYEIRKKGPSYTLDTVRMLKGKFEKSGCKTCTVSLIYGSDALATIESWYEPAQLMQEAQLMIGVRGKDSPQWLRERARELTAKYQADITFFYIEPSDLSSTAIRERMKTGDPWEEALHPAVAAWIARHRIYTFADDLDLISDATWQQLVELTRRLQGNLTRFRLLHSLNVMQYAVHLARVHQLDIEKAAIAGLLHDCAKCLPLKKQLKFARKAGTLSPLNEEIAHGPAGSYVARNKYGIKDRDVLAAIFYHTTSRGLMTPLDQAVYLADKIEFGRTYQDLEPIRALAETDLDAAMTRCLMEVYLALERKRKDPHPYTDAALKTLQDFA